MVVEGQLPREADGQADGGADGEADGGAEGGSAGPTESVWPTEPAKLPVPAGEYTSMAPALASASALGRPWPRHSAGLGWEGPRMIQNGPEWAGMTQNGPVWPHIFPYIPIWHSMP